MRLIDADKLEKNMTARAAMDKDKARSTWAKAISMIHDEPSAQPEPEDYTEMKQEFLRMASYIDVLLECSDEQRESLMGFISRLAEYMPWTERD